MLVRDKKHFVKGLVLAISFLVVLGYNVHTTFWGQQERP